MAPAHISRPPTSTRTAAAARVAAALEALATRVPHVGGAGQGAGWARVEEVPQDQAEAAHREQSDQRAAHAALADA